MGCCKLTNEIKNSSLLAKFLNDKKSRIRLSYFFEMRYLRNSN